MHDEYETRQLLAQGVRKAINLIPGNTKLDRAARIGVTPYAIDKWISGAGRPTEENLARIARLSGMDQETIRNGGSRIESDPVDDLTRLLRSTRPNNDVVEQIRNLILHTEETN